MYGIPGPIFGTTPAPPYRSPYRDYVSYIAGTPIPKMDIYPDDLNSLYLALAVLDETDPERIEQRFLSAYLDRQDQQLTSTATRRRRRLTWRLRSRASVQHAQRGHKGPGDP
jgi:hypothetical protein